MAYFASRTAFCLAVLIAAPAPGSQTTQSDPVTVNAEDLINPANEIVCRRYPPPTGSRIGSRRICRTQHQWDVIDDETRTVLDEAFNRSKLGSSN